MDVGALRPDNYAKWKAWIECTPVDLRARMPGIVEQDFLQLDLTSTVPPESDCTFSGGHRERWDVISLSLVLNFVPSPQDRGRMVQIAHAALKDDGRLFLALPAPCVHNSRYLTPEHLVSLFRAVGFEVEEERWKKGGKMAYWLFRKVQPRGDLDGFGKKVMLRTGQDRNNFCVLLSASP
jgi:25S rRNA (adenine2142-N1)-methyltransferase